LVLHSVSINTIMSCTI